MYYKKINDYPELDFFDAWLQRYTRKDKLRLANLGSEFLDEVYILLEQIRARRESQGSQND